MPSADALLYARHIASRGEQVDQVLSELGYDALLIHSGRPENRLFDDSHPPFRANAAFSSWLPLPFAVDCLLELRVGQRPRLWYVQAEDFWHVPPQPPAAWWADALDVEVVGQADQWAGCFRQPRALAVIGRAESLGSLPDGADLNPARLLARLDEIRTRKTAWERECIARANQRAVAGHRAARQAFRDGRSELDIHLAYLSAAAQDQDQLPYNSIVALNDHAAVLHYQHRQAQRPERVLSFLIDAGADEFGYAADVTRTWAAVDDGIFTELIEALSALQESLWRAVLAGVSFVDLNLQTHHGDQVESGLSGYFFPHGLGHFLGAQVHDVAGRADPDGRPLPPPHQYPSLRLTRELQVGNVLTIEPGLYFIPMLLEPLRSGSLSDRIDWALIDELVPYGGIRIEDNVLVSEDQPINFTRAAEARLGA